MSDDETEPGQGEPTSPSEADGPSGAAGRDVTPAASQVASSEGSTASAEDFASPRVLGGRYEVGELIGRGGMAEVHLGHDLRLGRSVAIKILRNELARDPSFLARFRREAQAAAGLNHPAIVAV